MVPGVRETPGHDRRGASRGSRQTRALLRARELQGLVDDLQPAVDDFAQLHRRPARAAAGARPVQPLPAQRGPAHRRHADRGRRRSRPGSRNYKEFFQTLVGLAGESQNFDGNGSYTRFHGRRRRLPRADPPVGAAAAAGRCTARRPRRRSARARPARRKPPYKPKCACHKQQPPGPERGADRGRPVMRQIRKQLRVFVAIVCLFVLALGGRRLHPVQPALLPAGVGAACIGTDFYEVEAELPTGQAVVPGQGQTVNIAGVKIGEVGDVYARERARRRDDADQGRVRSRSTATPRSCCGPKTGLKDMYLALDPGTPARGRHARGRPRARGATRCPDVNADEVLAQLDADTRAYLQHPAQRGRRRPSTTRPTRRRPDRRYDQTAEQDLREAFKRFEPTARDGERITEQLIKRRSNIKRVIHNFQQLSTALGRKDDQLAALVDSSNANFEAFAARGGHRCARRCASSRRRCRRPTTDAPTRPRRWPRELGPALERLRPFARELAPALRRTRPFLRETTPIIRDQIRPFARDVQPTVRDLRSATEDLAPVTPRLTRSFKVLNKFFNDARLRPARRGPSRSSSGAPGAPTTAPRCGRRRTRTARCGAASCWSAARPTTCSTRIVPRQPAARHARRSCSTCRPSREACPDNLHRPAGRGRPP